MKLFTSKMQWIFVSICMGLSFVVNAQTVSHAYKNQINNVFSGIDKSKVPYNLLLDQAMEFTDMSAYNGSSINADNYLHQGHYSAIHKTLLMAKTQSSVTALVNPSVFKSNWNSERQPGKIVLSGLYYKYSRFKDNAYPNFLTVSNNKYYDKYINGVWQNPYTTEKVFAISPPLLKYNSLTVDVELPSSLWYTNQSFNVQSIAIDFGDGNGYQTMAFNQVHTVTYSQAGFYEWKYKLTLTNNSVLYSHSKIHMDGVAVQQSPLNRTINEPCEINELGFDQVEFSGTTTYLGEANDAILEIDYTGTTGCADITRPLIVVEGFDSGLSGVENPLGEVNIQKFIREATTLTGSLGTEIANYDIIYVNWVNGKDYLQRNAMLLKDIIEWVNSVKVGNEPNVVLGQSMGGVIARYTLKDMEDNPNEDHDTSLYISHDAPHQGANIPLSIQYFAQHLVDQFVSTPAGTENINPNDNGVVTIEDLQELLEAPGTKQLLSYRVNSSFGINNNSTWQNELELKGYPQQTRNIAISNGSHCANPQEYNPYTPLVQVQGEGKTSWLTDAILYIFKILGSNAWDILGVEFDTPALFLGRLPGNSKFDMDFTARAFPNYGTTAQIYKGKLTFTKKLFWIADITTTITDRSYNNPSILSYDNYPGGVYPNPFKQGVNDSTNVFMSYSIHFESSPTFAFIPTPSALDVGSGNVTLNETDYWRAYNAETPPTGNRSIPFHNFTTSHDPGNNGINEVHISFNTRNGNWLATELNDIPNDEEVFNCTEFCSNSEIIGPDFICGTEDFSVTDAATIVNWTVIDPNNLVTTSVSNNILTVNQINTNNSGEITISVTYSNGDCGTATVTKENVWVGFPEVTNTAIVGGHSNVSIYSSSQFSVDWSEGTTGYYWFLTTVSSSCPSGGVTPKFQGAIGSGTTLTTSYPYAAVNWGTCTGDFVVNCRAINDCGSSDYTYRNVTVYDPDGDNPCDDFGLKLKSNPIKEGDVGIIMYRPAPGLPCDDLNRIAEKRKTTSYSVVLYNFQGHTIHSQDYKSENVQLENLKLKSGIYFLNVTSSDGISKRRTLVVK